MRTLTLPISGALLLLTCGAVAAQEPAPRPTVRAVRPAALSAPELRRVDAEVLRRYSPAQARALQSAVAELVAAATAPGQTEAALAATLERSVARHAGRWTGAAQDTLRVAVLARATVVLEDALARAREANADITDGSGFRLQQSADELQQAVSLFAEVSRSFSEAARAIMENLKA
jgi:hypothetical protein